MYRGEFKKEEWLGNVSLDFNKEFGIHKVSAGVSSEYRKLRKTAFWVYAKGIPTNDFHYDNLGATAAVHTVEQKAHTKTSLWLL